MSNNFGSRGSPTNTTGLMQMLKVARRFWRLYPPRHAARRTAAYLAYWAGWIRYQNMPGAEHLRLGDRYPCLGDRTSITPFDPHYFYQGVWAFTDIVAQSPEAHVDVGSQIDFVGMLSAITQVTFVDIRPLVVSIQNFRPISGSLLALPFPDDSVISLSTLHVIEHIGLGRYGDALDPAGTSKAAKELVRVLAPGGHLYVSTPVGRPVTRFNAHRIHSPDQILQYFGGLELVDFSCVDDAGDFRAGVDPAASRGARYSNGMFHFRKRCTA